MTDERVARGMRRQLELRRGRRLGWKLGFGAPAALEKLGLDGPLVGFLEAERLVEAGAEVALDGWANPMLEAEVAAHVARDIPAGADAETVRASLAGLGAAIELADLDPPPEDVEEILAGNIFHRNVILGPLQAGRRSVDGITARVLKDGREVAAAGDPQALTGKLHSVLGHVAGVLAGAGEGLRAGDVVIMGSVVPPQPVASGDSVRVELPPLGALSVVLA